MKPSTALLATVTATFLSTIPAFGQSDTDDQLARCRVLENKEARLICYDNLADLRMGTALSSNKDTDKSALAHKGTNKKDGEKEAATYADRKIETPKKPAKTVAQKREEEFGSESVARNNPKIKEQRKKEQLKKIEAQVLEILFTVNGKARYILDNGQSWQQIDTAIVRRWKVPFKVVLKRGSIGSYKLNKVGNNVTIRVKRIK